VLKVNTQKPLNNDIKFLKAFVKGPGSTDVLHVDVDESILDQDAALQNNENSHGASMANSRIISLQGIRIGSEIYCPI